MDMPKFFIRILVLFLSLGNVVIAMEERRVTTSYPAPQNTLLTAKVKKGEFKFEDDEYRYQLTGFELLQQALQGIYKEGCRDSLKLQKTNFQPQKDSFTEHYYKYFFCNPKEQEIQSGYRRAGYPIRGRQITQFTACGIVKMYKKKSPPAQNANSEQKNQSQD